MKSPDQIAMEAAEALFGPPGDNLLSIGSEGRGGWICTLHVECALDGDPSAEAADGVRSRASAVVRAAIEEALYQSALPNGMTAERLAEVARISEAYRQWCVENEEYATLAQDNLCSASLCDAVAELFLMRRVMDGPEAAAYAAGYDEGLKKGRREGAETQREASADEILDAYVEGDGWNSELCRRVARIVRNAPLATPGEEES